MIKKSVQRSVVILISFLLLFLSVGGVLAQEAVLLYSQDFESGQLSDWQLDPGWKITETDAGHAFAGQGHVWASYNGGSWSDYRLGFKVKLSRDATLHANFRKSEELRYFIGLSRDGLSCQTDRT